MNNELRLYRMPDDGDVHSWILALNGVAISQASTFYRAHGDDAFGDMPHELLRIAERLALALYAKIEYHDRRPTKRQPVRLHVVRN